MIPVQDVVPCRTRAWVTIAAIAIAVVVQAAEWVMPAGWTRSMAYTYGFVPVRPDYLRAATFWMLHAGIIHLASNIMVVWVFGSTLEDRFGHARFLALYLVSGLAGVAAVRWALPFSTLPVIGAGAAAAGITAAYLLLFPRSRILLLIPLPVFLDVVEVPALFLPAFWFLLQVIGTVTVSDPSTSAATVVWLALGAAPVGLIAAKLAVRRERMRVEWWA